MTYLQRISGRKFQVLLLSILSLVLLLPPAFAQDQDYSQRVKEVLERLQSRKSQRALEAEKHRLNLPSNNPSVRHEPITPPEPMVSPEPAPSQEIFVAKEPVPSSPSEGYDGRFRPDGEITKDQIPESHRLTEPEIRQPPSAKKERTPVKPSSKPEITWRSDTTPNRGPSFRLEMDNVIPAGPETPSSEEPKPVIAPPISVSEPVAPPADGQYPKSSAFGAPLEVIQPPAPIETTTIEQSSEFSFGQTLLRLQSRRESREKEAARLNIVLPSQGGSMAHASPSLARLNVALNEILQRPPLRFSDTVNT